MDVLFEIISGYTTTGSSILTDVEKAKYDGEYVKKITFWGDMKIILHTVLKVLKRSDIVREGTVSDIDFGDCLLMQGKIDQTMYDARQMEARALLGTTSGNEVSM